MARVTDKHDPTTVEGPTETEQKAAAKPAPRSRKAKASPSADTPKSATKAVKPVAGESTAKASKAKAPKQAAAASGEAQPAKAAAAKAAPPKKSAKQPASPPKKVPTAKRALAKEAPKPKGSRAAQAAPAKKVSKRAPLPGPEIKRAPKKAPEKITTHEKLESAEKKGTADGRRPLDGIRVLDLSRLLPGPYASHILASFGAEVIKIEKPGEGDYMRDYAPQSQGVNATFLTINRGKRSIAIDLRQPAGQEVFRALVRRSDVVLDGFRPGVMDEFGLGYENLRKLNPKLVYAALTGYGQTGPNATRAGHDLNYLALAGMLDLLADSSGVPLVPGIQIADVAAGALPAVIGILLALQHRQKYRAGQLVDISMFDSLLGLMPVQIANYTATKRRPKRGHERLFGRYACYNIYPVRNGRFMAVAALEPKFWAALCNAIERPDLIEDQYAEGHAQEILIAELDASLPEKAN